VAKVDGYMIQITGAGDYVGEKHLVRIEEAGRTSAVATLLDAEPSPAPSDGEVSSDGLESKPRRRGRRGGRRRSGAKAESVSSSE
jgi:ribonuclease G